MIKIRRRGRAAALVAGVVAASASLIGAATPAGASTVAATNTTMIGSGSATTYNLMQAMDTLYNDAPGCNLIDSSGAQTLDFECPPASNTAVPPVQGTFAAPAGGGNLPAYSSTDPVQDGYTENPDNDASFQEPPYGSSNGIKGLETQGSGSTCTNGAAVAPQSYARSSRGLKSSDCKGLNFVAYAVDGVSYFYYPEVNGHQTPAAANGVTNLGLDQLTKIWQGGLQCWNDPGIPSDGATTMTYSSPGCQPIIVYAAQEGSGTTNTWESALSISSNSAYVNSINGTNIPNVQQVNGTTATENYDSANHVSLENTDREILANGDEANAIFFFSYGKFQVTCAVKLCGKIPGATGTTTEALGSIGGIAPTSNSILCGAAVGGTGCGPTVNFPVTRFIYNVYSNGSNADIPEASPQVLNYVGEDGFICKVNTLTGKASGTTIDDPVTGAAYRSEIDKVIKGAGFLAMPYQTKEGGASIPHPMRTLLNNYSTGGNTYASEAVAADEVGHSATFDPGYCLVTTTDSNTGT